MTVFWMKLIAMVSMVTDHTAVFLYPHFIDKSLYEALRAVGRLAFPIYAYLIVNGYQKTSSVKRYLQSAKETMKAYLTDSWAEGCDLSEID